MRSVGGVGLDGERKPARWRKGIIFENDGEESERAFRWGSEV